MDGKRYVFTTGVKVTTKDWDKKRERCKSNHEANTKLEHIRKEAERCLESGIVPESLKIKPEDQKDKQPSKKPAKHRVDKDHKSSITDSIRQHLKRKQATPSSRHTWRAYSTLISNLKRFTAEKNRTEKYLSDITTEYLDDFTAWMIEKNYSNGHCSKMASTLRTVIRKIVPVQVWMEAKPIPDRPADQAYLSETEIRTLEKLQLDPAQEQIRDLFLIGYYTGQRFSDWKQIRAENITTINGIDTIKITQDKTKNIAILPVGAKLKNLLDKYPTPPETVNQYFNRELKKICKAAGFTEIVTITEHRGGKTIKSEFPKFELITSHTARRSFATNAYLAGIPIFEIMKFTGHKTMGNFLRYVRITNAETAIKYYDHKFFS